jgi:hypothetical protein
LLIKFDNKTVFSYTINCRNLWRLVMAGYNMVLKIRDLEKKCNDLGFMFSYPNHGNYNSVDIVALKPKDDLSVPIYSKDAEVFCGTLEELDSWLRGVTWARNYDRMLKVSDDKRRERREQDYRNQMLVSVLAGNTHEDKEKTK